jgi:amino acid transporter
MTGSDSKERALGAVSQLLLAIGAVAVVLAIPRTNAIVEVALVMVLVSAVVIAVMAWRLVWGEGKKRQHALTRDRRKLIAAGLFAFVAIAAGVLVTVMQPGNPILALVCVVVAGQVNALFTSRAPGRVAAVNRV